MAVEAIKNEKILYYFGAGASAKVLPLARTIQEKSKRVDFDTGPGIMIKPHPTIKGLAYELSKFLDQPYVIGNHNFAIGKMRSDIAKGCRKLAKKADEFGDVDTYAKYLQIMDSNGVELNKLKKLVSIYFSVKQTTDKALDSRYVPWLVSIMKEKKFPENLKILSWNYDSQIQLAARSFNDEEEKTEKMVNSNNSHSLLNCYPDIEVTRDKPKDYSLIHLNGRAGIADIDGTNKTSVFQKDYFENSDKVIEFLSENDVESSLHFAWENSSYHNELMKDVSKMIEDVTIMVVIGYSFPFFNREVDKEVFKQLKANKKFYKIYYQDPILDGQQLKSQFELDERFPIVHISQTDNFHIPFEY